MTTLFKHSSKYEKLKEKFYKAHEEWYKAFINKESTEKKLWDNFQELCEQRRDYELENGI